ncbi:MAG: sodium-independent anion transporter [Clostridia bacterium]|nr:sodium-independent anion transporter [Clostridia bacterium]
MKNYFKSLTPMLFISLKNYNKNTFIKDLIAGLIVGIIALPLSLALAIASGAPPVVGLITAIIGGGMAALLSGSRNQVSGPTAAFIPIVLTVAATCGAGGFLTAIFFSGVLLLIMGFLRLGKLINYIALPIIAGFTAGIAVSIFSGQLADFMGYSNVPKEFIEKIAHYAHEIGTVNPISIILGVVCIAIMLVMPKINKKIPGALIAIIVAVAVKLIFKPNIETIGSRFGELKLNFSLHTFDFSNFSKLIVPIISISLLAAIESLLSAKAADNMTRTTHNPNAELLSQGAANMASALFGGLPVTGAIARTSASIKNGGVTPVATLIHALFIFLIGILLMPYAVHIPLVALASVLIVVCKNMINVREAKKIFAGSPRDVILFFTALSLTVVFDLVVAIGSGMGLALLWVLINFIRAKLNKIPYKPQIAVIENGFTSTIALSGGLNFITDAKFKIKEIATDNPFIIIDVSKAVDLDLQGFMVVEQLVKRMLYDGKETVKVVGNSRCMRYIAKAEFEEKEKIDLTDILIEEQSTLTFTSKHKPVVVEEVTVAAADITDNN